MREMSEHLEAASPEVLSQIYGLMGATVARIERQRNAISQAVNNATLEDVNHGVEVMEAVKILGEAVYTKYRDCPFALAGLAYTAGIAEGKQQERDKRRYAAIKRAIKETGNIPRKYMK